MFEVEAMRNLTMALNDSRSLVGAINRLNDNSQVYIKLTFELQRSNDLKAVELGIMTKEDYQKKYNQYSGRNR